MLTFFSSSCFFAFIYVSSSSCVFKDPHVSPIRVLTANIIATPSTAFKLPSYVVGFARQFAEASSPPLLCTRLFNKLVSDFLDVEAKQSEDSDRDDSHSH